MIYLQMNLLLMATYLALQLAQSMGKGSKRGRLRFGQALLLLGLVLPGAWAVLPQPRLSGLRGIVFTYPAEGESVSEIRKGQGRGVSPIVPTPGIRSQPLSWGDRIHRFTYRYGVVHWALWFLLLGAAIPLVQTLRELSRLLGVIRDSVEVKRYGRVVLSLSEAITIPLATLVDGKARVIIPSELVPVSRDYRIAVAHELEHHRQKDTAWTIFLDLLVMGFYFNPAIHLWKRKFDELQELACDEALMQRGRISRRDYSHCLLSVAARALQSQAVGVGVACMARGEKRFNSFLKRRIHMLSKSHEVGKAHVWVMSVTMLFTVTVAFAAHQTLKLNAPSAPANPGTVVTDGRVQAVAEKALRAALEKHDARLGFVVVSEPITGRILAVANQTRLPGENKTGHWALSLKVEAASAMKGLVAALAVDWGLATVDERLNCENGKYKMAGVLFQDWKPFSQLTVGDTVVHSSNICGIKVAQKLGAEGLEAGLKKFGFGPGGSSGGFPEAAAGEIESIDAIGRPRYIAVVGTGYEGAKVTPLEMVQAYGAIANGGNLMTPLLATAEDAEVKVVRRVLSESTARAMRQVLADVVRRGTASSIANAKVAVAGKTSTAYAKDYYGHDTLGGDAHVAGFVGFAPIENPKYLAYAGIFDPLDGDRKKRAAHGSLHAAPVVKEVMEELLQGH